ncbi:hypothetical protein [Pseudorhodoplanes sp.]|uniref:hypothetical protein n=1 Tax=Pseudorhodoplanes sp. TaxID=1934341 RepID=UPI003D0D6DFF
MAGDKEEKRPAIWGNPSKSDKPASFYSKGKGDNEDGTKVTQIVSTERHVASRREDLGFLDRVRFDHRSKAEMRKQLGEIFINMLEKQKQEILYRLSLELDGAKKQAFAEYMRVSGKVEREIAQLSNEFEDQLIDFGLEFGVQVRVQEETRKKRISALLSSGQITKENYDKELDKVEQWCNIQRENLDAKITIILQNHATQIEKTLQLFKERKIGEP